MSVTTKSLWDEWHVVNGASLILASLNEKQSSDVTTVLCLERKPSHSFFSTTQQAGRGGCWGQQVSVSDTIHCALWGSWLRISSKQLLWVLKLVQSFQAYILPPIHLPVTEGSEHQTIAFIGFETILHVLLNIQIHRLPYPRDFFLCDVTKLIYVALFFLMEGTKNLCQTPTIWLLCSKI